MSHADRVRECEEAETAKTPRKVPNDMPRAPKRPRLHSPSPKTNSQKTSPNTVSVGSPPIENGTLSVTAEEELMAVSRSELDLLNNTLQETVLSFIPLTEPVAQVHLQCTKELADAKSANLKELREMLHSSENAIMQELKQEAGHCSEKFANEIGGTTNNPRAEHLDLRRNLLDSQTAFQDCLKEDIEHSFQKTANDIANAKKSADGENAKLQQKFSDLESKFISLMTTVQTGFQELKESHSKDLAEAKRSLEDQNSELRHQVSELQAANSELGASFEKHKESCSKSISSAKSSFDAKNTELYQKLDGLENIMTAKFTKETKSRSKDIANVTALLEAKNTKLQQRTHGLEAKVATYEDATQYTNVENTESRQKIGAVEEQLAQQFGSLQARNTESTTLYGQLLNLQATFARHTETTESTNVRIDRELFELKAQFNSQTRVTQSSIRENAERDQRFVNLETRVLQQKNSYGSENEVVYEKFPRLQAKLAQQPNVTSSANAETTDLPQRLAELEAKLETQKKATDALEVENIELFQKLIDFDMKLTEQIEAVAESANTENTYLPLQLYKLEANLKRTNTENAELRQKLLDLGANLETRIKSHSTLIQPDAPSSAVPNHTKKTNEFLHDLFDSLKTVKKSFDAHESEINNLKEGNESKGRFLDSVKARLKNLTDDSESMKKTVGILIERSAGSGEALDRVKELEAIVNKKLGKKAKDENREVEKLREEVARLGKRVEVLETREARKEHERTTQETVGYLAWSFETDG